MTRQMLTTLAAAGSFALLAGAYTFEFFGYPPCQMCYWQRWPHFVAIAISIVAYFVPARVLALLGALAAFGTSGVGVYHTGVERDWWEGPTSCTGGGLTDLSATDLLSTDGPRLVMCDQVSWEFLTLSMASWNALFSFGFALIWLAAARKA
ncbi:disulfide bond formation protein B [Cognatiyoonia sp.]|uniref:disulfide bond formation protein B n=1 Tax=Cognatiyoonia sp. TaxID=2211652 RepID=UPI003F6A19C8